MRVIALIQKFRIFRRERERKERERKKERERERERKREKKKERAMFFSLFEFKYILIFFLKDT